VTAVGGTFATKPSTRVILTWETDESDLDLRFLDAKGWATFPRSDAQRGYGPELFPLEDGKVPPQRVEVHQVRRGPSGYALGKVTIVRHDGQGALVFDDRPFVIMSDGAAVMLGALK